MVEFNPDQDKSEQIALLQQLAHKVLSEYPLNPISVELINYEYNATFKVVDESNDIYALRINVNSKRTVPNVRAEIAFIQFLSQNTDLILPTPIANLAGEYLVLAQADSAKNQMPCVLYNWLLGNEVGNEPSTQQLFSLGVAMAKMHLATKEFKLPKNSSLPVFEDVLWETTNNLTNDASLLDANTKDLIATTFEKITQITDDLYSKATPQVIHADLHCWNLMWHDEKIAIFDFDDCGIGLPLQDLAVTIYYLDAPDQVTAVLAGYESIANLPSYGQLELDTLLIQRRLVLLNYLYETKNPEHKALIPKYQEESVNRCKSYLDSYF